MHPLHRFICVLAALLPCAATRAQDAAPQDAVQEARVEEDGAGPERFTLQLVAAAGAGQRAVSLPTQLGLRKLDTGLFPALAIALSADTGMGAYGLIGASFHYETSVGLSATESPPSGIEKRSTLRANRVEAGLTPGVRFGTSEHSARLQFFAGWSFRGLRSVVDMSIPNYTLHGPVLRPELRIPLAKRVVELRLAPEAQLLVGVTRAFQQAGATSGTGVAYAGEITLDIRLASSWLASLAYRESHALLTTPWADKVTDVERYVTAGIALSR